jgi:hypothetical protein
MEKVSHGVRSASIRPMKRLLAIALVLVLVAAAVFATQYRRVPKSSLAEVPAKNPGHFVPSDVAQLATTGRPQLVEVFHYG